MRKLAALRDLVPESAQLPDSRLQRFLNARATLEESAAMLRAHTEYLARFRPVAHDDPSMLWLR